ncbi:MAG TPA: HPP family protein [Gallionellaceae bacterium]|nr:HPP family protein [Gallionellaceae bacterium]
MNVRELLSSFKPGVDITPFSEKIRSSVAALAGMALLGLAVQAVPGPGYPLTLLASMAAAAVLLFAVPHSPMAQPWPLLTGNLLSGAVGWACALWIPGVVWAAAAAVGLSIFVMHLTRSLHPPGAATAMVIVLQFPVFHHDGGLWTASMVFANVLFSLLFAILLNNLAHRGRYPVWRRSAAPAPLSVPPRSAPPLTREDVEWAVRQMEGVTDVSAEDLLEIYRRAAEHAHRRD